MIKTQKYSNLGILFRQQYKEIGNLVRVIYQNCHCTNKHKKKLSCLLYALLKSLEHVHSSGLCSKYLKNSHTLKIIMGISISSVLLRAGLSSISVTTRPCWFEERSPKNMIDKKKY